MEHLAEQRVLDLIEGVLVAPAIDEAHAHLDACEECRAVVANALRSDASFPAGTTQPNGELSTLADMPAAIRGSRPLPIDQIDEYRLLEQVGRGGMGMVYRAHDTLLDREVAVKLIARTSSEDVRQRFLVEARAVARIRHPNVVVVHRVGIAHERPYIVYDLVRGHTVADIAGPLPWFKTLAIAVGIARGLAAAHACGVLHRDLKPANIMIDEHEEVILVDFGLAKLDGDGTTVAAGDLRMTQTGVAMGTPRYMAPEAWRGDTPTPQTDVYSFGLVLFELLAGRLPFADAAASELARRVCETDPPSLATVAPWVPSVLCALVDRCTARDPARRPATAAELVDELEAIQRGRAFEDFERDRVRRVPQGNPYPGARPFGFEHQGVFFGRADELRAVIDELRTRPLVVVAGEAGAGKTSLCMAGVLPLVARGALAGARKWVPVPCAVGHDPIGALADVLSHHLEGEPRDLASALRADPDPIVDAFRRGHRGGCTAHVLFIDQLDALATIPRDEAVRFARILARLAEPGPAIRVLATLRADAMMVVAQLPNLATVIGPALFLLVEPRDEARLRDIVVEPARLSGRLVSDDVARSLVSQALPLRELQQRLATLWAELPVSA